MNKKVILIFALTIVALIALWLYSFGPLSENRVVNRINPESLKPSAPESAIISQKNLDFNTYHNRDLRENYYTIKFPEDWQVQDGKKPGSYILGFKSGSGKAELIDVPDNSTLELFILSQQEPQLKKKLKDYKRLSYIKTTINGAEAYQLVYADLVDSIEYQTLQTYIAGPDNGSIISFKTKAEDYSQFDSLFIAITNSFQWENK